MAHSKAKKNFWDGTGSSDGADEKGRDTRVYGEKEQLVARVSFAFRTYALHHARGSEPLLLLPLNTNPTSVHGHCLFFKNEVRVHGARRKIGKTKAQAQIWRSHWWNGRNICAIVFSRFRWSFYLAWRLTDGLSGIIRITIAKSGLNILAPGVATNILKLPS